MQAWIDPDPAMHARSAPQGAGKVVLRPGQTVRLCGALPAVADDLAPLGDDANRAADIGACKSVPAPSVV